MKKAVYLLILFPFTLVFVWFYNKLIQSDFQLFLPPKNKGSRNTQSLFFVLSNNKLNRLLNNSSFLKHDSQNLNKTGDPSSEETVIDFDTAEYMKLIDKEQMRLLRYLKEKKQSIDSLDDASRRYFLLEPCNDMLCTEYLSKKDRISFKRCKNKAKEFYRKLLQNNLTENETFRRINAGYSSEVLGSGSCRFMDGSGRGVVGLVSFPGSGNTWVRGLLQKATGICTGAIYCDRPLRIGGMDGEAVEGSSTLVVKDHSEKPKWNKTASGFYDSVILLIRNPYDVLIAQWNRKLSIRLGFGQSASHTKRHGAQYFGDYEDWKKFVNKYVTTYWSRVFDWILSCPTKRRLLVVRYEDIRNNSLREVKRMLDFLQYPYTDTELEERMLLDFSQFHRSSPLLFNPYSPTEYNLVATEIKDVISRLKEKLGITYGVEDYLPPELNTLPGY